MKFGIMATLLAAVATAAQAGPPAAPPPGGLYLGGDLSYVNEMEDCGAVYRKAGQPIDPFKLLKQEGGNLVRVRIWVNPTWTKYSNYPDVLKTIRRAHAAGLQALLDFHYSDDWADGGKQIAPAAWAKLDTDGQVKALHDYTLDTLRKLDADHAMPEMVQVGNETNPELLGGKVPGQPINWTRNAQAAQRRNPRGAGSRPRRARLRRGSCSTSPSPRMCCRGSTRRPRRGSKATT